MYPLNYQKDTECPNIKIKHQKIYSLERTQDSKMRATLFPSLRSFEVSLKKEGGGGSAPGLSSILMSYIYQINVGY